MKNNWIYDEIVDTALQIHIAEQYQRSIGNDYIFEYYTYILGLGVLKLKKAVLTLVYNFLYNGNL